MFARVTQGVDCINYGIQYILTAVKFEISQPKRFISNVD